MYQVLVQQNTIIKKNTKYQRKNIFKGCWQKKPNIKIGLEISNIFEAVFSVGNLKHFIMYMSPK